MGTWGLHQGLVVEKHLSLLQQVAKKAITDGIAGHAPDSHHSSKTWASSIVQTASGRTNLLLHRQLQNIQAHISRKSMIIALKPSWLQMAGFHIANVITIPELPNAKCLCQCHQLHCTFPSQMNRKECLPEGSLPNLNSLNGQISN